MCVGAAASVSLLLSDSVYACSNCDRLGMLACCVVPLCVRGGRGHCRLCVGVLDLSVSPGLSLLSFPWCVLCILSSLSV